MGPTLRCRWCAIAISDGFRLDRHEAMCRNREQVGASKTGSTGPHSKARLIPEDERIKDLQALLTELE